jgi:hypothetical protein
VSIDARIFSGGSGDRRCAACGLSGLWGCAYLIDPARGKDATDQLLGEDFSSKLIHEGWAPYNRYIDATNWRGEHTMRFAVVNRKVGGGNRTRRGANRQMILMSVLRTLKLRSVKAIDWMYQKLIHQNPPILA